MSRGDFGAGGGRGDVQIRGGYGDAPEGYPSARNGDSEYIRLSNCISSNIQQLTNKIAAIQRMVNQIGTNADVPEMFENLQMVQKEANMIATETATFLKQSQQIQASPSEARQRKIQMEKLQENFSNALHKLQQAQRQAVEKEREHMQRVRTQSAAGQFDSPQDTSTVDPFSNNSGFQVQQEADVDLDMIREREEALRNLETDIVNVNEIFKDLAIMVHEQGETIDSIEANVDHTHTHVEAANVQLQKAKSHQTAARKKKCCLLLILIIAVVAIALVIYFSAK
jgi:syntaxin 12/13